MYGAQLFGNEHTQVSTALYNFAMCLKGQDKHEEAIQAFEESLKIERSVSPTHTIASTTAL